jgi:hypothetical protein
MNKMKLIALAGIVPAALSATAGLFSPAPTKKVSDALQPEARVFVKRGSVAWKVADWNGMKAETKAVGRALAMLGYGTQFAPEMDEGERIVDSPVAKPPCTCSRCGNELRARKAGNKVYYPKDIADISKRTYGVKLCWDCMAAEKQKAEVVE